MLTAAVVVVLGSCLPCLVYYVFFLLLLLLLLLWARERSTEKSLPRSAADSDSVGIFAWNWNFVFHDTFFMLLCFNFLFLFISLSLSHSFSQLREDLFGVCAQKYAIMECIKHTPREPRATQALHATKHRTKRGTSSNASWKETSLVKEISTTLAFPQEFARARLSLSVCPCTSVCACTSACVCACLKY